MKNKQREGLKNVHLSEGESAAFRQEGSPFDFWLFKVPQRRETFNSASVFRNFGEVCRRLHVSESPPRSGKSGRWSAVGSAGMSQKERPVFYRQDVNKTIWEVPERYQNLSPVGSGAYGSVR